MHFPNELCYGYLRFEEIFPFTSNLRIAEFFWKMQRKTWYSILGLDTMALSLLLIMKHNMRIKGEIKYLSRTFFIHSRWPVPVPSSVRILSGLLVSLKHVKWNKTACAKNFSPQIQTLRFTEYLYYNNTSIIYFFKCTVYCTLTIFMCHMQMCVV